MAVVEPPLVQDFRDLLVAFVDAEVEFVMVGGWALALHGYGYRMGVKPNLIEVLTSIDGIDFDEAVRDAGSFELEGRSVPFIGRAALMKNKRAAGRPKDLADLAWLEGNPESDRD